jgi:hypothetical protein
MLANQFLEATVSSRTSTALDEIARKLWRAHAEAQLDDAAAEAVSAAVEARRAVLEGRDAQNCQKAASGAPRASRRREKMFGLGRPRALDRNAKVRIMHWARCLSRRTEKGRAYGVVTAKAVAVLEALLWVFHNNRSGLCFPSYETIASAAHCARSTSPRRFTRWRTQGSSHGSSGSSASANPVLTCWATTAGAGGYFGRRTATPSPTLRRPPGSQILLSPKSRLEHRTKPFSLLLGPPSAAIGHRLPAMKKGLR